MPCIVGGSVRVVDTGILAIDELAGNVASKDDRISIAHVTVSAPTNEPWLTLHYDEWICVLTGRMLLHSGTAAPLEVKAGQTAFIEKGTRFQPEFPEAGTTYVPVCLPAFRPDRCIREEENGSAVAAKLHDLHASASQNKKQRTSEDLAPEVLYHMCQRSLWDAAQKSGEAYFPPTFEEDGGFTHATAVPTRLIETANHFYQDVPGEWVCLKFRRSSLRKLGIVTRDECAKPVGTSATKDSWTEWVCPHVFGGLPPQVVDAVLPMTREGPKYLAIEGLTDVPDRVFKLATAAEAQTFHGCGMVSSALDMKDGFVHLSDRQAAPVVAKKFFKDCADLRILELNVSKLPGPTSWIVGRMGDAEPDASTRSKAATTLHYLKPDGCVHAFGDLGVPTCCIAREEPVPLGPDGVHKFPDWF